MELINLRNQLYYFSPNVNHIEYLFLFDRLLRFSYILITLKGVLINGL
jgi:hypothetical protein